jgi:2,4-dienoyl-CoA reductase (NADPH2)
VTLFEANDFIGGQFDLAGRIPGNEEFSETIRYFTTMLDKHGVVVRLGTRARAQELTGYDDVVLATGVVPRIPAVAGVDHPMVLTYAEAITGAKPIGRAPSGRAPSWRPGCSPHFTQSEPRKTGC